MSYANRTKSFRPRPMAVVYLYFVVGCLLPVLVRYARARQIVSEGSALGFWVADEEKRSDKVPIFEHELSDSSRSHIVGMACLWSTLPVLLCECFVGLILALGLTMALRFGGRRLRAGTIVALPAIAALEIAVRIVAFGDIYNRSLGVSSILTSICDFFELMRLGSVPAGVMLVASPLPWVVMLPGGALNVGWWFALPFLAPRKKLAST